MQSPDAMTAKILVSGDHVLLRPGKRESLTGVLSTLFVF